MDKELEGCSLLITQHFSLDEQELTTSNSLSQLKSQLTHIIKHLLDHDINRLLNAFYKIDINELRFKEILSSTPSSDLASTLADEVIDRELLKVKTREKYKNW